MTIEMMGDQGRSINSSDNDSVSNNRVDESDDGLIPSPFEDNNEVSPNTTGADDVRQFRFVLEEDAGPWFSRGDSLTSQFTPQSFRREQTATLSSGGGYSMPHPILQWISGGQESLTMTVRLFSTHAQDRTAEEKYVMLKALKTPNPDLNRPPLVSFFWGQIIPDGMPCMIEGFGDEQFDEIRPDGSIRGITLQLTIKRFQQFFLEQENSEPQTRTPSIMAKDGDTYEMIALRAYGDPMYGILLRRMNPRKYFDKDAPELMADLQAGEKVKIYPKRDMQVAGRIMPECHIYQSFGNAAQARELLFQIRGKKVGYLPRR